MKQILFYDKDSKEYHGGILLDSGDVVCGCCGGLIEKDDTKEDGSITIIKEYDTWISLDNEICGDDLFTEEAS